MGSRDRTRGSYGLSACESRRETALVICLDAIAMRSSVVEDETISLGERFSLQATVDDRTLRLASDCRFLRLQIPFRKHENKQYDSNDCEIAKGGFLAVPRVRLPHEEPFPTN